jgi:hypothetical protein
MLGIELAQLLQRQNARDALEFARVVAGQWDDAQVGLQIPADILDQSRFADPGRPNEAGGHVDVLLHVMEQDSSGHREADCPLREQRLCQVLLHAGWEIGWSS